MCRDCPPHTHTHTLPLPTYDSATRRPAAIAAQWQVPSHSLASGATRLRLVARRPGAAAPCRWSHRWLIFTLSERAAVEKAPKAGKCFSSSDSHGKHLERWNCVEWNRRE